MVSKSLLARLDRLIHAPRTELALVALILITAILVVYQVVISRQGQPMAPFVILELVIRLTFIAELVTRYLIARKKQRFFRHYWLDLIAILPIPPGLGLWQLLPLLRLPRAATLINRNLNQFSPWAAATYRLQITALLLTALIIVAGGLAIFMLEGQKNQDFASIEDSLWWSFFSLISAEPIGGDARTRAGRFVTVIVILGGLTLFAVFTGIVSAVIVRRFQSGVGLKSMDLDELREHIIICGWNRSLPLVLQELQSDPDMYLCPIVIVAELSELPELELRHINQNHIFFYSGDYTRIDVLEKVEIHHASRAILLADFSLPRSDQDRDARTVLAALTIEKLKPGIYTCAQLLDRNNNVQLQIAGVEDIVVADEMTGHLISSAVRNLGGMNVISELLTVQVGNQIYRLNVPKDLMQATFWQAHEYLKFRYDALLIAVETLNGIKGKQTLINPPPEHLLQASDYLIVIARQAPRLPV
ncbi:ion transporter [Thermosynechococcaceae cyanobacterium BACA0444]|uniref:BK channel n=1 Tax=Pseudocalidococcus azoricus BACA0444 TaxID=2918990 RepID=A0AAE4JY19_9CYAN|nr:ion transporter [Pseudocalidococcus azoricus]MDS3860534.1 ion transporter [Pseudocalidococcus azoricus BACA0444]